MIKNVLHGIEKWLWRSGMHNPRVRAVVCVQIAFALGLLALGAALAPLTRWPLWFAVGALIFANVFWGLARHLLRVTLTAYSSGLLLGLLLRAGARLLFTGAVLYAALILCSAPAVALVGGVAAGVAVALGTYALTPEAGLN